MKWWLRERTGISWDCSRMYMKIPHVENLVDAYGGGGREEAAA